MLTLRMVCLFLPVVLLFAPLLFFLTKQFVEMLNCNCKLFWLFNRFSFIIQSVAMLQWHIITSPDTYQHWR